MPTAIGEQYLDKIGRLSSEVNSSLFLATKRIAEVEKTLQRLDVRVYVHGPVIYSCSEPWCDVQDRYQSDALKIYHLDFGRLGSALDGCLLIRKHVYLIDDATNKRYLIKKKVFSLLGSDSVAWRLLISADRNLETLIKWVYTVLANITEVVRVPLGEAACASRALE